MTSKVQYVQRVLSDRIAQPGRWHVVREVLHYHTYTKCGKIMDNRLYQYKGAPNTLQYSEFPRNARTADQDDTNVCQRCVPIPDSA